MILDANVIMQHNDETSLFYINFPVEIIVYKKRGMI